MSMDLDQSKPFTKEQRLWAHEWGLDHLIEENERRHAQRDLHDEGKPVNVQEALSNSGLEVPPPPPNPTYVGMQGGVQQGPLIVEGEDNAGRVPLPRDHAFTGTVEDDAATGDSIVEPQETEEGKFDTRAVRAEVKSLNVDELKDNLRDLGEPVSGSKEELRDRLVKALKKAHDEETSGDE